MNAYINFGEILSICSQDIERKCNYDGRNDGQFFQSRAIINLKIHSILLFCSNLFLKNQVLIVEMIIPTQDLGNYSFSL